MKKENKNTARNDDKNPYHWQVKSLRWGVN